MLQQIMQRDPQLLPQGWASYDERVDVFSAGVTVFELFRPFATGMERVITLRELRDSGTSPADFAAQHPQARADAVLLPNKTLDVMILKPFTDATDLERVITLRELQDSGTPPPGFAAQRPQVSASSSMLRFTRSAPHGVDSSCCTTTQLGQDATGASHPSTARPSA